MPDTTFFAPGTTELGCPSCYAIIQVADLGEPTDDKRCNRCGDLFAEVGADDWMECPCCSEMLLKCPFCHEWSVGDMEVKALWCPDCETSSALADWQEVDVDA